jgi:hypothetical protein
MMTPPRNTKYAPGSGTKPSVAASGVKGKIPLISATSTVVTASGRLGRLRKGFMWQPRLAMLLLVLDERVEERLQ